MEAGHRFGVPTYGTQAHSWIMAHDTEEIAFAHFLDLFPRHSVLLLDTYDVRAAIEKVIAAGRKPRGVRLDSGDVAADSAWVRERLDQAGWGDVEIFFPATWTKSASPRCWRPERAWIPLAWAHRFRLRRTRRR